MWNPLVICGCFGAVLPDGIRLIRDRYQAALSDYFKHAPFWVGIVLMVILGGFLGLYAHSPKEALACGFSGPEIITRLLGSPNKPASATGGSEKPARTGFIRSMRDWWGR